MNIEELAADFKAWVVGQMEWQREYNEAHPNADQLIALTSFECYLESKLAAQKD